MFYGFTKRRLLLFGFNIFFEFLSILFFIGGKGIINPPSSVSSIIWSIFFYTGFIADYYIYAIDISGILLFSLSALYLSKRIHPLFISIFGIFSLFIILFHPPLPYTVQWHNFFFVYPGLPVQSFLFGVLIIVSLFLHMKYGSTYRRFFAAEILIVSSVILFVTGIFPGTRTDPSSRHLLLAYPFMIFLLMELLREVIKRRDMLTGSFIIPLILSAFFHGVVNIYNSSVREDAIYKAVESERIFLRIYRREVSHNCLYVVGPNYFLPEIRDFVNPWGKGIVKVVDLPSGSLTDVKTFELFLNYTDEKCEKKFFLVMRFRPVISPLYDDIKNFFEYFRRSQNPLSDQYMMAQYAYMHSPNLLPVEELLYKKTMIHESSVRFHTLPLFVSELVHRIIFGLPFAIPYEVKSAIFKED